MKTTTKLFITLAAAASILLGAAIVDGYRHGEKSVATPTPADAIAVLKARGYTKVTVGTPILVKLSGGSYMYVADVRASK
jgi:hypothetical protein